jgi:hypothetical protein
MRKIPLNVLCVFHNSVENWLLKSPDVELCGCNVTSAHTIVEALKLIRDQKNFFDVVLFDLYLPYSEVSRGFCVASLNLLTDIRTTTLVRGVGIFVPLHLTQTYAFIESDYYCEVATRDAYTFTGDRDWAAMLDFVLRESPYSEN